MVLGRGIVLAVTEGGVISTWQDRLIQLVLDNLIEPSMFVLYR
jgi:hypothetical protein